MTFKKKPGIIVVTVAVTAVLVVLGLNLSIGDERVDRKIETLYTVADPQFMRTMGVMLGPALIPGNRAEVLLNGDIYDREFARAQSRIFEADLKHSRRITLEEWENRPWSEKLWEHTLGLFSSQL